jgi:hypothetical protein
MPHTEANEERVICILTKRPAVYPDRSKDLNDGIALAADFLAVLESIKTDCLRGAHKMGMSADGVLDIVNRINRALKP